MVNQAWDIALYGASLVTFTFGALTFSVLVVMYWRDRHRRHTPVLAAFTLALAASFVINLTLQVAWAPPLELTLRTVTSLLPALIFHLVYTPEAGHLPAVKVWRWLVIAFYPASLTAGWNAPAIALGAGAALGLAVQIFSQRVLDGRTRHHRFWIEAILGCILCVSAIQTASYPGPLFSLLPDYLVLALFCVTLYYQERLIFFDLVIKRGAMFLVALTGLTVFAALGFRLLGEPSLNWMRIWVCALALTPFWLAAPWIYRRLENFLDRVWLGRRYSMEQAEQKFAEDVQAAVSEAELRNRSTVSLGEIFGSAADVSFDPQEETGTGMLADLVRDGSQIGRVRVHERSNGTPFLSDDHRLLRGMARTLAVVLQNVRFRERQQQQEEREQHLRLLASRAELKALRAQINPHFLFNALNAIAGLIADNPQLADETIERLARVFRYALSKSETEWVRLDEEMEFVEAYLRIEQARFGKRLQIEMELEGPAGAVQIPAVSLQPLVENAIKHGVAAIEGPGIVAVRAGVYGDRLRVEIFDSGSGFPPDFSIGMGAHGLRNISDRLTGYYGASARLWWQNGGGGNRVFVEFPVVRSVETNGDTHFDRGR